VDGKRMKINVNGKITAIKRKKNNISRSHM
jgi:hypothetical protein